MIEHEEPEKTLEAHPASVHDILTGIYENERRQGDAAGQRLMRELVERWPRMQPRERSETVKALLSAPWLPQATKNALRAADQ